MKRMRNQKGFTLIELIMVIVIVGILAAVAIPKFLDLSGKAKQNAAKGGAGGLRATIAVIYSSTVVQGFTTYPSIAQVTGGMVGGVPPNPYNNSTSIADAGTAAKGTIIAGGAGWAYRSSDGEIWCNVTDDTCNTF